MRSILKIPDLANKNKAFANEVLLDKVGVCVTEDQSTSYLVY